MNNQNKNKINFGMYGIIFGFFSGLGMSFLIDGISVDYCVLIGMAVGWFVGKNIKKK